MYERKRLFNKHCARTEQRIAYPNSSLFLTCQKMFLTFSDVSTSNLFNLKLKKNIVPHHINE